jgi:hypothetical protein
MKKAPPPSNEPRELCYLCGSYEVVLTSAFGGRRWFARHLVWLEHGITVVCAGEPS